MGIPLRRSAALIVASALSVASVGAGCSGDDSDEDVDDDEVTVITDPVETTESTTSTEPKTEPTDPDAEAKAEVEAAYLEYFDRYFDLFSLPTPENPILEDLLTGAALDKAHVTISDLVLKGRSIQAPPDEADFLAEVHSISLDGDSAVIRACLVDGSMVVDNATGSVLNDALATYLTESTLIRSDRWRIAETTVVERREGRWSCE